MGRRYANILETVGNTPVVKINRLAPPDVNLYVKVEAFNPLGSVKDRLALGVIEDAERTGKLKPGQTVVEALERSSGPSSDQQVAVSRYQAASPKLEVEYLDPERNIARAEAVVKELGIRLNTVVFRSGDRKKYVEEDKLAEFDYAVG